MNEARWQALVDHLRGTTYRFGLIMVDSPVHRIEFEAGLTDAEIAATEVRFGFRFPPDLREFLQTALPCSPRFPNWRSAEEAELRGWLDAPREGVLFDVECGFWWSAWGPRPDDHGHAVDLARMELSALPPLIPVYGHRYLPSEPHRSGNPVFSVYQTDVIYYGADLEKYLAVEFGKQEFTREATESGVRVPFWTELAEAWD